jgi:SAM-dependent methyltransferase
MRVVDAGCGSGFFSNYFISRGCKVYSLDYSEKALEIARKITQNKSFEYLNRDLLDESLGLEFKNTFDLIFTDGLFEHFSKEEQEKILKAFITMKKKGGLIATFVPNRYSFWTVIRPIFMHGIKEKPFTLKELASFIEGVGQKVIEKGGINVLPVKYSPEFLGERTGMLVYAVSK